ncbi:MAG TPA: hypothetical protein VK590_05915 [Saprospiraceae bacterium]|nr:hypothetical protein [Saprospiraceae bacterium]
MSKYIYEDDLKIKDALELYFSRYHFPNGGYDLKWFKIKIGPVYLSFPNTKDRIAAVKLHDIHHVITGYEANIKGEAEIGAWEIGSGCGKYYVAWILNGMSFLYGIFIYPKAIYKSFLRARLVHTNLYHNTIYSDELLNKTVGELKYKIGSENYIHNKLIDYFIFIIYCLIILSLSAGFLYLLCCTLWKIIKIF